MAAQWQRWLKYAKAKLDSTVRDGDRELDRLEAEQQARVEGRPWLASSGAAPTFDEVKARIEHQGGTPPETPPAAAAPPPRVEADGLAVEAEARQRAAESRLDAIRDELGLDDDPPPPPA
jgi:hypothetical protein